MESSFANYSIYLFVGVIFIVSFLVEALGLLCILSFFRSVSVGPASSVVVCSGVCISGNITLRCCRELRFRRPLFTSFARMNEFLDKVSPPETSAEQTEETRRRRRSLAFFEANTYLRYFWKEKNYLHYMKNESLMTFVSLALAAFIYNLQETLAIDRLFWGFRLVCVTVLLTVGKLPRGLFALKLIFVSWNDLFIMNVNLQYLLCILNIKYFAEVLIFFFHVKGQAALVCFIFFATILRKSWAMH